MLILIVFIVYDHIVRSYHADYVEHAVKTTQSYPSVRDMRRLMLRALGTLGARGLGARIVQKRIIQSVPNPAVPSFAETKGLSTADTTSSTI